MKNIVEIQKEARVNQGDQEVIFEKGDRTQILNEKTWSVDRKIYAADLPFKPGVPLDIKR